MTSSFVTVWREMCPVSPDSCEEQHFDVAHTSFGARGVRKNCAQGGVCSVAEDLKAASPVSHVFSFS